MSTATPSEKFADWFFARFVFPFLMVCLVCIAITGTYALCRWLIEPQTTATVAAFHEHVEARARSDRSLLTRGDISADEALKRRAQHDVVYAHIAEFLQTR